MKNIDTLSSLEGRATLAEVFNELRFEKQLSNISTLILSWRICVRERELFRYVKKDVTVLHPLGLISGTGLWMEEILVLFHNNQLIRLLWSRNTSSTNWFKKIHRLCES
jgi:hypothetical protein